MPLAHHHVATPDKLPQPNDDHSSPNPHCHVTEDDHVDSFTHRHVTKGDYPNSIADHHVNGDDDVPRRVDGDNCTHHHRLQVSFIPHLPPSPVHTRSRSHLVVPNYETHDNNGQRCQATLR